MKIAVVGCGALGSFYGARLAARGEEVHFLMRSDYEAVKRNGLTIHSPDGELHLQPECACRPEAIGPSDLVLIGLKTTANRHFASLLPPLVHPDTALLTLQNGLGNEADLARIFPETQILGGLCFVCLNRVAPGVVHHTAHGKILLGEFRRRPLPRTHEIAGRFQNAGIECIVVDDLERAHWEKLVWNVPFNGLGVAGSAGMEALQTGRIGDAAPGPCLPTDQLLSAPEWENLVSELMLEIIGIANALGHDLPREMAGKMIARTRVMGAYRASTLIDFERSQPLELESLFQQPLRLARGNNVDTPRLTVLCAVLEALEKRRAALRS